MIAMVTPARHPLRSYVLASALIRILTAGFVELVKFDTVRGVKKPLRQITPAKRGRRIWRLSTPSAYAANRQVTPAFGVHDLTAPSKLLFQQAPWSGGKRKSRDQMIPAT